MSNVLDMESINNLDESDVLGYFETIKSAFITKMVFFMHFLDGSGNFVGERISEDVLKELYPYFAHDLTFAALRKGNEEIKLNFQEEVVSSAILFAWNVFEQIAKDLPNPNYSASTKDTTLNFHRNDFGLNKTEKDDLDFFYYVRNAITHYNGAYNAYKTLDFCYKGDRFLSSGHEGEKISISSKIAWSIVCDLEIYTIKAWQNFKKIRSYKTPTLKSNE